MTYYALSLLRHGVQLVLFFSSSTCLSPTSPPAPPALRGKSQEHSSIRERHGTFSSDSLEQEWANMLSSFFLLMFVGIKCQVTQVHFAGAEKYCWKMLLCLYVAGQRQICPSCSKIPESSYGMDTLLRYFGHTSQEQRDGKAFCSLALHLFQKAVWLTVLVPAHLSGSDERAAGRWLCSHRHRSLRLGCHPTAAVPVRSAPVFWMGSVCQCSGAGL